MDFRGAEGLKGNLGSFSQDMNARKGFWLGWVESTLEAEKNTPIGGVDQLNRVRVRIFGLNDFDELDDLPLAQVLMPNTIGNVHDIGGIHAIEVGAQVFGVWLDRLHQHPVILGCIASYTPESETADGQAPDVIEIADNVVPLNDDVFEKLTFGITVGGDSGPTE